MVAGCPPKVHALGLDCIVKVLSKNLISSWYPREAFGYDNAKGWREILSSSVFIKRGNKVGGCQIEKDSALLCPKFCLPPF